MADRADAANPRSDPRHLGVRPADAEPLKPAKLSDDNQTRSLLPTDQKLAGLDSTVPGIRMNPDGGVTVWFGPKAPEGHEKNWVQTMPGTGYNVALRLYGPLEPWFKQTWRPGDIDRAPCLDVHGDSQAGHLIAFVPATQQTVRQGQPTVARYAVSVVPLVFPQPLGVIGSERVGMKKLVSASARLQPEPTDGADRRAVGVCQPQAPAARRQLIRGRSALDDIAVELLWPLF